MNTGAALDTKTDDLSVLFGPCDEAGADINPQEYTQRPQSLQMLDSDTAPVLADYLATASNGLLLSSVMHRLYPVLWLIDRDGRTWFAIEEIMNENAIMVGALGSSLSLPPGHVKLGHPSLLMSTTDKRARIGGEIKFFPLTMQWKISNRSGRYGLRPHQTEDHLNRAAELFASFGINLTPNYWPVRQR